MLYAKLSREVTPTTGIFLTSANAFIVAIPILIPVNDPGPKQHESKPISSNDKFVSLNISSTSGIRFCECVFSSLVCFSRITSLSSSIDTEHILDDVSIANIFMFNPF